MKSFFILSLLMISMFSFSQEYKLFNASAHKVFTNYPLPDSTLSIAFDSVCMVGTDSVYYNFTQPGNMIISSNCQFWGPPECTKQDRPTWLGSKISYNNSGSYKFYTNSDDILNFNFSATAGQPTLFYESATEKFYYTFTKTDTIKISDIIDSARFYTVSHTNISGTPINSTLNGKNIIIGKNLGLIQFFQVDAFPQVLNPVFLLGQQYPELGFYTLTNEMLYDYAIGDVIQYHEKQHYNYGPPQWNYDRFIRFTIVNKSVTTDSVIYTANKYEFDKGASSASNESVMLKYKTHEIVTQIPYEYTDPNSYLFVNRSMRFDDYCGVKRWTYREKPAYGLGYCENENCWGARDVPGPPPFEETIYTCGLGVYKSEYSEFAFYPTDPGRDYLKEMIYYKKNGVSCGSETFVGLDNNPASDDLLTIYPVPASEFLTVETPVPTGSTISIMAITGQELLKQNIFNKTTSINIGQLKSGIYLLRFESGKSITFKKMIKE